MQEIGVVSEKAGGGCKAEKRGSRRLRVLLDTLLYLLDFILCISITFLTSYIYMLFRAAPAAYGSSQVRGQIGAAAASLCHTHSNVRSLTH